MFFVLKAEVGVLNRFTLTLANYCYRHRAISRGHLHIMSWIWRELDQVFWEPLAETIRFTQFVRRAIFVLTFWLIGIPVSGS